MTINEKLSNLRDHFKCERALIFEYHNGGTNLSGLSFQHMSVMFERNAIGLYPLASEFQRLALSLYPILIKDIDETDCLYIDVKESMQDYQSFTAVLDKENISSAVIVPIYGIDDPIGFIVLGSEEPRKVTQKDKQHLHQEAQKISSLLDYKRYLIEHK